MDAGYRDPKARFIYSLRSNGKYQLIVLGCAVAGLIYITISHGFDFTSLKALVMALAYVWGLILAIYLMGHGLVALPRHMFRNADISGTLRRIQSRAPGVHEKLEDAISNTEELEAQVLQLKQRKTGTARDFQEWIDELGDMVSIPEARATMNPGIAEAATKVPAVITERYLADLSRRLAHARHQRARYIEEWDRTVQRASDIQAILDSKASKKLDFGRPSPQSSVLKRLPILTPYLRYHLYVHFIPAMRIGLGALFSLASIAIIWSELIRFPAPQLSAVSLTVIHHPNDKDYQVGFGGQIIAASWICYMCTCALSSVNDVPVWRQRALVRRNTYSESACWYAGQIAKLTVPLSYNFLTFLPQDIHQNTTFYDFLGRLINLTPLGTGFDYFFPIFILLPVCATFFNLYGRIKNVLGFGLMEDEYDEGNPSGFGTGGWREGRELIVRDLAGAGGLGLTDSPRQSLDHYRPSRTEPRLWVPPAERTSSQEMPASQTLPTRAQRVDLDLEPEEENFFTLFGRRIKNTVDTIETPKWMQNSPTGIKRPKWMGGSAGNERADGSQSGSGLGRWFGGRPDNGQVRI
jgi:hypothetical protein